MRLNLRQELMVQSHILAIRLAKYCSMNYVRLASRAVFRADINAIAVSIILANGSFFWALSSFLHPDLFSAGCFEIMRGIGGSSLWGCLFGLHFCLTYWRIYDHVSRPCASLVVNSFGFVLWFFANMSIIVHDGLVSPATALQVSMCIASAWVLYKTGAGEHDEYRN